MPHCKSIGCHAFISPGHDLCFHCFNLAKINIMHETKDTTELQPTALDVQVGGEHYKALAIQPVEYMHANKIPFIEGNIIKYVTRWRDKGGIKDLEKAKHFIDLLIQLETK